MEEKIYKRPQKKYFWAILTAAAILAVLVFVSLWIGKMLAPPPVSEIISSKTQKDRVAEIKKFSSEREFQDYLEKAKNVSAPFGGRGGAPLEMSAKTGDALSAPQAANMPASPSRVSETNVQVAGIDEPDAVKTDGKEIYFSSFSPQIMPMAVPGAAPGSGISKEMFPVRQFGGTKAIKAFPPDDLKVDAKIDKSGDLLLAEKNLVVIPTQRYYFSQNDNKIFGFDVSNPEKPKETWNMEIKSSSSIVSARMSQGKLYLALKTDFSDNPSCVIQPLLVQGAPFSVRCTDIYHPTSLVPAEATYTVMIIDPTSGKIEKNASFVGSSDYTTSTVYMSENAIYLTYYYPGDFVKTLAMFFSENKGLVPEWLTQKLKNLEGYDISNSAKMTEVWNLIDRYQNSLSSDDRMKAQNEIANKMSDFLARHRRDLDSTGIVKMSAGNLNVDATGNIPGKILNQFSLDEYKGDLRVATTVGENFLGFGFGFGGMRGGETANDVYILGDGLRTEGSVLDLGKGERIFAVRFIDDKGYVVTFKQVDPFYVLNLSDPMNPEKTGELKIPGYSSYLHPLAKDRILGVGEENNQVKISLFDVSDASNPGEIAKYNLDEYYSAVSETHHAFLEDAKHQIFFLPGAKGGYIFSYAGDSLNLAKTVADTNVKRALFINDLLYIIGENKLVVLDENNWSTVGELDLK